MNNEINSITELFLMIGLCFMIVLSIFSFSLYIYYQNQRYLGLFIDSTYQPWKIRHLRYPRFVKWKVVKTPEEFIKALAERRWDIYSFGDVDCLPEAREILFNQVVVFYQVNHTLPRPFIYFHSLVQNNDDKMSKTWIKAFGRLTP